MMIKIAGHRELSEKGERILMGSKLCSIAWLPALERSASGSLQGTHSIMSGAHTCPHFGQIQPVWPLKSISVISF
jgi:hypothetical protein